mmetsp:Transcript_100430/g.181256  ORF Transcript_100430/g.181256 Transcript_100430/m.181256 type:complete len:220 (-) Transcript_100430:891-1550(-)
MLVSISGDMFFIMSSAAFIMSGLFIMSAIGSPVPSPMPWPPPFCLISIIFCMASGSMPFIMLDIILPISGLLDIISAILDIMSASGPAAPEDLAISAICFIISGFSIIELTAFMSGICPPPELAAMEVEEPVGIDPFIMFLRSSSLMPFMCSMAWLRSAGFSLTASMRFRASAASTPGGSGAFFIIRSNCSGDMFFMACVASESMSGFWESLSKASLTF